MAKFDHTDDSLTPVILFRWGRVGSLRYTALFASCLASLAILLLVFGAILSAIVFTEVRPPTADENYRRHIGADYRRIIGPLMMGLAAFMFALGCVLLVLSFRSSMKDRIEYVLGTSGEKQQQNILERSDSFLASDELDEIEH